MNGHLVISSIRSRNFKETDATVTASVGYSVEVAAGESKDEADARCRNELLEHLYGDIRDEVALIRAMDDSLAQADALAALHETLVNYTKI